jgi:hypothetical protein
LPARSACRTLAARVLRPVLQDIVPLSAHDSDFPQRVFARPARSRCFAWNFRRLPSLRPRLFSNSSPNPGADCRRGSGGRRSWSLRAIGRTRASRPLPAVTAAMRNIAHISTNETTIRTKSPRTNFAMPADVDVADLVRHIDVLDVRRVGRFRSCGPFESCSLLTAHSSLS